MHKLAGLFLIALALVPVSLYGQNSPEVSLPENGDVRIIVDISGSMKTNDPQNLRQPAVRLLARLLPDGTEAGVWTFGQWVNMLVPHNTVDEAWRRQAVQRSGQINSVALRTNLGEALEVAGKSDLSGEALSNTDFILLTDGQVDVSDAASVNLEERKRILGPVMKTLVDRGATLHTIALSEQADLELLEALAAETGGHYSLASSAEDLSRAFLKALNAAVPQEQIPLNEEGFTVDSGIDEFTALIFWGDEESSATRTLELIDPTGQRSDKNAAAANTRWAAEVGYDLITVSAPSAGKWQINGELGEGSRVTVVSDLRMVVSPVPPSFSANEPVNLQVAFFEQASQIQSADFLRVIEVTLRLTASDGRSGSKILSGEKPPEDGVYTDQIASLPTAGDYDIEVIADGKTFSRRFSGTTRFTVPEAGMTQGAQNESPVIQSPIDVSDVELPQDQPVITEEIAVDEPRAAEPSGTPGWLWGLAGGLALLLCAGGLWFGLKRRNSEPEDEAAAVAADPEPEAQPESKRESKPESEQKDAPEPESDDEYGLEEFDLSEYDGLPEDDDDKPLT